MKQNIIKRFKGLFETIKSNRGMTLMEIMIVMVIIGILGAIVAPKLLNLPKAAKVTSAKQQIKNFEMSIEHFNLLKGNYPTTEEGLTALKTEGSMRNIPNDPWGNPYVYRSPGENDDTNDYEIMSYGQDGAPGGEGFDADIKSWDD